MSQENVEVVRQVFDATARRDLDAVLDLYDAEVVLDFTQGALQRLVGGGIHHGHEGVEQAFRPYHEAWDNIRYDIEELIDAGDQVVSIVNNLGRGRSSGAEVEMRVPGVWTLRKGKIVRVVFFSTREQALEAVGLSE